MSIPNWYELLLLSLATWRVWHLLAQDTVLNRPRRYMLRLDPEWTTVGDYEGDGYRLEWAKFLTCPYCAGFWIGVLWWMAFECDQHWTLVAATPFAISAGVVAAHKLLTQDE